MEVTRNNFKEVLPIVKKAIDESTFLAIDCEFTGLYNKNDSVNLFDTQKEYYEKCRSGVKQFLAVQYGICCFRFDEQEKIFKHQAFNFYLFARPSNIYNNDTIFSCQSSCIDFLIKEGFDFNKMFKEGISYLNVQDEAKYKDILLENQKKRASNISNRSNNKQTNILTIPNEEKPFIDEVFAKISDFVASGEDEMQLLKCNAFKRRLIYQKWDEAGHEKYSLETRSVPDSKDRVLFVTKPKSQESMLEQNKKKEEEELAEFEATIGFSKVIRHIVEQGKLIIGHNVMLDFLHTIDKFLSELPADYTQFKEMSYQLFPKILDTKFMCSTPILKEFVPSSVLPHVVESVSKDPFIQPRIDIEDGKQGYSLGSGSEHVAAYDAFTTGFAMICLWKYLGSLDSLADEKIFTSFALLEPFLNRIPLMRIVDNPYIRLGGPDEISQRDHVFYVKFPKEWKYNDLMQLFSPFGNISIGWIDSTSAYIGLVKRENAVVALRTLSQSDTYSITTYAKRQAQLKGKLLPQSPSVKSRKSGESFSGGKRRKTNSFGEKTGARKSFDPIAEEMETEDVGVPEVVPIEKKSGRKRTLSTTFTEDADWD